MTVAIPEALALAVQHHQAGRLAEAEALYRQILAADPNHAEARHLLGVLAHQAGRNDLAAELIGQAIALNGHMASAHSNLGLVLTGLGELDKAIACCRRALVLEPGYVEAYNNLGNALRMRGDLEEGAAACRQALALQPDYAEAHSNLASALWEMRRFDEALAECRRAIELKPDLAEAHCNLGNVLKDQGLREEAMAAYRRALELNPGLPTAHYNLGNSLMDEGDADEAIACYQRALQLKPDYMAAHVNLGNVLKEVGLLDESIAAFRRALQINPEANTTLSNLINTLHFHPDLEKETLEAQHEWNRRFGEPLAASILPHTNDRDPERRLRIGYVSRDFGTHSVAFFLAPLLEAHNHERFEIHAYSSLAQPDATTGRLRQATDRWREVCYLSDEELAARILEDGIDILVDLSLHSAGNRLLAFARKPAPVQVSWLGYPGSTGVKAIGYRVSDGRFDPVGMEETASGERVIRLPDAWCCFAPFMEFPEVKASPATTGQGVTFGSLNQFGKVNKALLKCWAALLRALPDARLLMVCRPGQTGERTLRQFAEFGVARERVELVAPGSWAKYIGFLERIDVALDTYPGNGMTTSCHALWMGVPVVTRAGASAISRAGLSLLHTIGLPELVAQSEEEYVRIAVELAGDLKRLGELRSTLRARMAASPLMDAPRFARNMEAAYRTMWRQWCQGEKAR